MLTFLLEEGVISVGAISGIFTGALLTSLKSNLLDPLAENLAPSHILHPSGDKETFDSKQPVQQLKWKIFIRDFIIWIIIMFILYLLWNYLIKKIKKN
jgi:large-conductance mechanosensitive channel